MKKIFINILKLFLSFISLASVHNYVLNVEKAKGSKSKNKHSVALSKNTNIKSSSSVLVKEGIK
ncbi:hypothetical protein [Alkaliphilus sp. B6464]|uniref:hypothetical protein n=1 Tax=Alkaliphilus sp. B6464 TaxID=2731219 RepID=UPI001BA5A861|nr:hypothetical protein [Alkaliphilus sp. B6464]QUH18949.1 hypothetical protein HYG84_03045 [Alkaliphilus sp. B6464]